MEGMVRINSIPDDYYIYIEDSMSIVGKESGKTYTMGQAVKVRVVHVDKLLRNTTGELIPKERLRVVPHATLGIRTKEMQNRNKS